MSHEIEYLSPSIDDFVNEIIRKSMKTLVIHPDDRSTDFLKKIYEGKDYTVVTDHEILRSRKKVTNLIKDHDRIMMMGHGYPGGLFFTCITASMVYLLREKECVCIWCHANQFVEKYGLKGFYTGMFLSEVGEAYYYDIKATQEQINYSNNLFSTELNKVIDDDNVHHLIKEAYSGDDPVIQYNNTRLYYREGNQQALVEKFETNDDDTMEQERLLAERDLEAEMRDWTDDLSDEEQPDFGDDLDPAGGHGLYSHI